MGYVKTAEEIAELQSVLAKPQARDGRMLYIPFTTDESFVAEVLPPGLRPGGGPASLTVGEWRRSNAGPYRAAFLMVSAVPEQRKDLIGSYCLSFFINDDSAILFGRPMMGEPKKLADIDFAIRGTTLEARVRRFGTELVHVTATLGAELPVPEPSDTPAFWYKHQPAEDGHGLQYDPILVLQMNTQKPKRLVSSKAELVLKGTAHDPLEDVPMSQIGTAYYTEGDLFAACSVIQTVDREKFLPYAFAGYDDWTALIKEGS